MQTQNYYQPNKPKPNDTLYLEIIGSIIAFISLFLPYIAISGSSATIDSFTTPVLYIPVIITIIFAIISAFKYNSATFREDFASSKDFALVSFILGVISIVLFIFIYQGTISYLQNSGYSYVTNYISPGIGFFGVCIGVIMFIIAFFKVNGIMNNFPSRWQNSYKNYAPFPQPNQNNLNSFSSNQTSNPTFSPQSSSTNNSSFCTNCGSRFLPESTYCTTCGNKK